jgi:phosphoribosyl 1,2-cyclic phosphodiesterase
MITFTPYASSSSGNLYTVSDGITTIMLECGLPWRKIRESLSFKTSEISAVCLTHFHLDHAKGAADAAKAGLDIYASRGTFNALKVPPHRANEISDGKQFTIGSWSILPFSTIHDTEGSLGFYMSSVNKEACLFMTDTAYSPVKFKDLSVIAVECNFADDILAYNIQRGALPAIVGHRTRRSHLSLETLKGMLKANDLSKLEKIYLLHMSSGNSDEMRFKREIMEITGVPVYVC